MFGLRIGLKVTTGLKRIWVPTSFVTVIPVNLVGDFWTALVFLLSKQEGTAPSSSDSQIALDSYGHIEGVCVYLYIHACVHSIAFSLQLDVGDVYSQNLLIMAWDELILKQEGNFHRCALVVFTPINKRRLGRAWAQLPPLWCMSGSLITPFSPWMLGATYLLFLLILHSIFRYNFLQMMLFPSRAPRSFCVKFLIL